MGSVQEDDLDPNPIVILSLSASGAMIQAHQPPREGAHYLLEFTVHRKAYALPLEVVVWLQEKDAFGWRCRFLELSPENAIGIEKAVHGALGLSVSSVRDWPELLAEASAQPHADIVVGQTPAGHDLTIKSSDLLQMDPEGLELYVRMMSELERM